MTKLKPTIEEQRKGDFRIFLIHLWKEMGLPKPTPMQLLFADALQRSNDRLLALLGYRGFAKTYISCAFLAWKLYKDPTLKVCIWASNQASAADSTQLMLNWFKQVPWLLHMAPTGEMDQSALSFDVQGRGQFRGSSVTAYGMSGTITGTRADLLLVDDPETSTNGDTAKKRIAIDRAINEASLVLTGTSDEKPTRVIILGTVHFDDSLYTRLIHKKYRMYLFPICVPPLETQKQCWQYYLEPIRRLIKSAEEGGEGLPVGTPLDRFGEDEIEMRRGIGLLNFERQCLVNPFRSTLSEKPFDLSKAIIFDADTEKLPIRFYHVRDERFVNQEMMGFSSASLADKLYSPSKWDEAMAPYDRKIMWVDPAGDKIKKGADETSFGVMGTSSGYAVLFHMEGMVGGSRDENLLRILEAARLYRVDCIYVEDNLGLGMFAALLRAKQMREYGRFGNVDNIIPIENRHSSQNKGKKIVSSIDPVLNFGKLILTPNALMADYESANVHSGEDKICYRLTYQLSYGNESGNKLDHDDRVECLAMLCQELRGFLIDDPSDKADTWDDWIIRRAFAEDSVQFLPGQGLEPVTLSFAGCKKSFRQSRKSFAGSRH